MKTSILRPRAHRRLIQQITSQSMRSGSAINRGFTLIELLVVVIIVGVLASIALPSFLNQAAKAKASSAKALAASAAKECQVALMEGSTFQLTTKGGNGVDFETGSACTPSAGGTFTVKIDSSQETFTATVDAANGGITKTCSGGEGCSGASAAVPAVDGVGGSAATSGTW